MTPASRSVYYFGFYLLITGLTLIVAPNFLLALVQIEPTTEIWIRVLGALVINVGLLYVYMAPGNHTLFFTLTVFARYAILLWFTAFVLLGWAPAQLLIFGLTDAAGATWTFLAMKK